MNSLDIENALQDCQGVHLTLSGPAELPGAQHVSALAVRMGVERITYVSGATAFEENRWFPLTDTKLRTEEAILGSGVPFTIFCPTWPMEMLVRYARAGKPMLMGKSEKRFHWFAANDLARIVSASYQTDAALNKRLYIHGPEAFSMHDALMRYCSVFHPEVTRISIFPLWLATLMGRLTGNELLQFGAALTDYLYKVGEMGDPTEANQLLGAPAMTLDSWLQSRMAAQEN